MRRVLVLGSGGAGKSTLSRRLGGALGLEVIHLDAHYWQPGWVETPKEEWFPAVEALLARGEWVMDGNYGGTLERRLDACDTIVFIDLPRALCLWRILKRIVMYRKGGRPDMAEGCHEKFDFVFLRWVWDYPAKTRPLIFEQLRTRGAGKRIIHLRTRAEVERFVSGLEAERGRGVEV